MPLMIKQGQSYFGHIVCKNECTEESYGCVEENVNGGDYACAGCMT